MSCCVTCPWTCEPDVESLEASMMQDDPCWRKVQQPLPDSLSITLMTVLRIKLASESKLSGVRWVLQAVNNQPIADAGESR